MRCSTLPGPCVARAGARSAPAVSARRMVARPPARALGALSLVSPPLSRRSVAVCAAKDAKKDGKKDKATKDKKAPEPQPEAQPEGEGEEEEEEMWSVALAVTLAEKREKEVTNGALCAEVRKIVVKACPRLPNKKQLAAMGLDDDEAVVVLADSDAEDIFDVEEGVLFAEMLLFKEEDVEEMVPLAIEALVAKGFQAEPIELDDDDEEEEEEYDDGVTDEEAI